MKRISNLILILCLAWLTACHVSVAPPPIIPPPQPVQHVYTPSVQFGYMGNTYGAYITDTQGEQFFMDYVEYNILRAGGYNNVVSYYYNSPRSQYIHVYQPGLFHPSHSADAIAYTRDFNTSYHTTVVHHTVYLPSHTLVVHDVQVHRQVYGTTYSPTTPATVPSATGLRVPVLTKTVPPPVTYPSMAKSSPPPATTSNVVHSMNLSKPGRRR